LRGNGPDNLFEDILSFLRVIEVMLPMKPAKDSSNYKVREK
jgi:hypothetical protein